MGSRWMRVVPLAAFLGVAACRGDADDAPGAPSTRPATGAPDSGGGAAADSAPPGDSVHPGLAVVVERRGGEFALAGRTDAQALELSVEDGHNVLYGPAVLEVSGGAFRTAFALEPTTRPTVFAYLTEPDGTRQWVVPIPLDRSRVVWGTGAAELADSLPSP